MEKNLILLWKEDLSELCRGLSKKSTFFCVYTKQVTLATKSQSSFIEALPKTSRCADNYKFGSHIRNKAHAIRHQHIELNNDKAFKFISIDVDYDIAKDLCFVWENNNLPEPTYAVINPANNHAHLIFMLENYIFWKNDKQVSFYEDVKKMLTDIYHADPDFTGMLTKNPLHDSWKTIESGIIYTLAELKAYAPKRSSDNIIQFNKFKRRTINNNNAILGHRCELFERSRIISYNEVRNFTNQNDFFEYMIGVCSDQNPSDLKYSDILSTAKSISRYTWKYRERYNRGYTRNRVTSIEDLHNRQRTAATATAATKHAKTLAIIEQAINSIVKQAIAMPALTKQLIAKLTGKSLSTIKRYAAEIDQFIRCAYQVLSPVLTSEEISISDLPVVNRPVPLCKTGSSFCIEVAKRRAGECLSPQSSSLSPLNLSLDIIPPKTHVSALAVEPNVVTDKIWSPFSRPTVKIQPEASIFLNCQSKYPITEPTGQGRVANLAEELKSSLSDILELIDQMSQTAKNEYNSS